MQTKIRMMAMMGVMAIGFTFGDTVKRGGHVKVTSKIKASKAPMKVEEPSEKAISSHSAKNVKLERNRVRGLSSEQKKAFRERKEKMQQMVTVITEKRRALQAAKPEERAALARELHSLILERDPEGLGASGTARVDPSTKSPVSASSVPTTTYKPGLKSHPSQN